MKKVFNTHGNQLINNIIRGFENRSGWYTDDGNYEVFEENMVAKYIDTYFKGNFWNRYLFCPNESGEIDSIALYGSSLQGHYNAISTTMMCFGLKVQKIIFDTEGDYPFLDIYLVLNQ